MAEPSVSPADTPAVDHASPRPWTLADAAPAHPEYGFIKSGHQFVARMSGPLTNASVAADAALIVQAVNERDALLAVGERDKADIEALKAEVARLADRAVCSGCGSDIYDDGGCSYPTCEFGELMPSSELPLALQASCDKIAELATAGERDRRQIARLTEALAAFFVEFDGDVGMYAPTDETEAKMRAAVLAGEEDAQP